ncbi:MAG: 5-formyltetrahydrofolate cyclo-ligase [Ruminococcus sp.]|jgi:5-formyltetrahydrofolate cyclo-ligase
MDTKQSIRKEVFSRRKAADPEMIISASKAVCEKILHLEAFRESSWLYTYMDFNREVMTKDMIREAWKLGKRTAVPRVSGKDMTFYEITSFDQLEPGYFQIPEPVKECPQADCEESFLIIPGVAFDKKRHRIGYGQGFYDRYLSRHPLHKTAAVAFDFQVFEAVPFEELDITPQILVTETQIY